MKFTATLGDTTHSVEFTDEGVQLDDKPVAMSWEWIGEDGISLIVDGRSYDLRLGESNGAISVLQGGYRYDCIVEDQRVADLKKRAGITDAPDGPSAVKATMPGLVLKVLVEPGACISRGDHLMVIEAMKMENDVKAPRDGTVISVRAAEGEAVEQGRVLVEIE